jgi:hypothetical protein
MGSIVLQWGTKIPKDDDDADDAKDDDKDADKSDKKGRRQGQEGRGPGGERRRHRRRQDQRAAPRSSTCRWARAESWPSTSIPSIGTRRSRDFRLVWNAILN